jgi:F-type H+-transporting ATPase subunit c
VSLRTLDRYAAGYESLVLSVRPHRGPGARSAPKETGNQPRGTAGVLKGGAPWLVSLMFVFLALGASSPLYAQEGAGAAAEGGLIQWSIITAGFALAIAAAGGALGQGRAVAAATEAIARNPGAAGEIRGALILGLVLIESLVIYVLLVSLILFFLQPFSA